MRIGSTFGRRAVFAVAALLVLGWLAAPSGAAAAGRVALVVGNSAYAAIGTLPNPGNDAADVAAALGRLGFEVETVRDADRAGLNAALRGFTRRSVGADVALVFYAGHGLEMDGVNYLVPVDARLASDTAVRRETVSLDTVRVVPARVQYHDPRYWGNAAAGQCGYANGADRGLRRRPGAGASVECADGATRTARAGSLAANRFGLHDTLGNASEWVADCWHDDYSGAPNDGAVRLGGGGSCLRVIRGGSWAAAPGDIRAAGRDWDFAGLRSNRVGFRVVREID